MPSSTTVGSVGIRVLPETRNFVPSLEKYLNRVERQVELQVRLGVDASRVDDQVRVVRERVARNAATFPVETETLGARAKLERFLRSMSGREITINVDVDRGLAAARQLGASFTRFVGNAGKIGALTLALNGVGTAAVGAVAAVGELTGVVGLLPALGAAGAAAIGTLVVGMRGFGDALKNMGDPKKFGEALNNLAPSARAAAVAVRDLSEPFGQLRLDVQQRLFQGLGKTISQVGTTYLPVLREGMTQTAGAMNSVTRQFAGFLRNQGTVRDTGQLFTQTSAAVRIMGGALKDVMFALRDVGVVGSQYLPGLAQSAADAAARFRDFVAKARQSGKLGAWIESGISAFRTLWSVLKNIGAIIGTVFTAMNASGGGFLITLDRLTSQLRSFLESAQGQQAMTQLGQVLGTVGRVASQVFGTALQQLAPILVKLAPALTQLAEQLGGALVTALNLVGPLLQSLAGFLSENMSWLGPIIIAVGTLAAAIGPLVSAFTFLRTALTVATIAFNVLRVAFLTNPFTLIITAVVALVAIIISNWDTIKTYLLAAWNAIKAAASAVWNAIKDAITVAVMLVKNTVTTVWNAIKGTTLAVWNAVRAFVVGVWNGIVATATAIWNGFRAFFTGLWNGVKAVVVGVWNAIRSTVVGIWNGLASTLRSGLNSIRGFFSSVWNAVKGVVVGAWNGIRNAVSTGVNAVVNFVKGLKDRVLGALSGIGSWLWNAGKDLVQGLINGIGSLIGSVADTVVGGVKNAVGAVGSFLGIGSPSRLMMQIGQWTAEGMAIGIEDGSPRAAKAAQALADGVAVTPSLSATLDGAGQRDSLAVELRNALAGVGIEVNAGQVTRWVDRQQLVNSGR